MGRNDDTIVLLNGKKADPAIIETTLKPTPTVAEAVVFGVQREQLGVLLVPREGVREGTMLEDAWTVLQQLNRRLPAHNVVVRHMLVALPASTALPKSSKGTVQRILAWAELESVIEACYSAVPTLDPDGHDNSIRNLDGWTESTREIVCRVLRDDGWEATKLLFDDDTDLFRLGVNSIQAARMRTLLQAQLHLDHALPRNAVFEHPTISKLTAYIVASENGRQQEDKLDSQAEMLRMVDVHTKFDWTPDIPYRPAIVCHHKNVGSV